jgi:hypothetical protein
MATAVIPNENADTSDDYLEIFSVVWFDANINIEDIRDTKKNYASLLIILRNLKMSKNVNNIFNTDQNKIEFYSLLVAVD